MAGKEAGSATVWVLLASLVVLCAAAVGLAAGAVTAVHRQASAAADLSALAGATTPAQAACDQASRVARLNGAFLVACQVLADGSVRVAVGVDRGWLPPIVVVARAGHTWVGSAPGLDGPDAAAPSSTSST
ncbi:MAG: Rv3654c family TadE-like protein [Actinomycetes bacterium]